MGSDNESSGIEAEIERLINAQISNDDLFIFLGEQDGALFASPSNKKNRGLRFFRNAIERIQDQICVKDFIRNQGDPLTQRNVLAIAAMLDFLGTKGAATVSVLILQIGLENVCAGRWK